MIIQLIAIAFMIVWCISGIYLWDKNDSVPLATVQSVTCGLGVALGISVMLFIMFSVGQIALGIPL